MIGLQRLAHFVTITFLLLTLGSFSGHAQSILPGNASVEPAVETEAPSPNDVKELLRLLEDQQIKGWLEKAARNSNNTSETASESLSEGLMSQFSAALDRTRKRARLIQGSWHHFSIPEIQQTTKFFDGPKRSFGSFVCSAKFIVFLC